MAVLPEFSVQRIVVSNFKIALSQGGGSTNNGHEDNCSNDKNNYHYKHQTVNTSHNFKIQVSLLKFWQVDSTGLRTVSTAAGRHARHHGLVAGGGGGRVVRVVVRGDGGRAVLVADLERGEAVGDTSHVVEPSLGRALLAAPGPTEEAHHCIGLSGKLDILTRLIRRLVEFLTDKVGNGPHHGLLLLLVLPVPGSSHILVHADKVALLGMT